MDSDLSNVTVIVLGYAIVNVAHVVLPDGSCTWKTNIHSESIVVPVYGTPFNVAIAWSLSE